MLQAAADTTIKQGDPDQAFGGQKTLALREHGSRVLVRFDPAAIAVAVGGGSLASAQLQLYIGTNAGNWGPTGRTVDAYRIDAPWEEGAATWDCAEEPTLPTRHPTARRSGTVARSRTTPRTPWW